MTSQHVLKPIPPQNHLSQIQHPQQLASAVYSLDSKIHCNVIMQGVPMFIKHKKRNFFHVWSNDTRNGMILTQAQYSPLYQSI